jgi:Tfp pilus assembly protein PilF
MSLSEAEWSDEISCRHKVKSCFFRACATNSFKGSMKYTLAIVSLFVLSIPMLLPSVSNEFVWDDNEIVGNNLALRAPSPMWVFTHPFLPQSFGDEPNLAFYRPLQSALLWIVYRTLGLNAVFYRSISIGLYFICAAIALLFFRKIFIERTSAFVAFAYFILLPLHIENVCFISSASDILATIFILLSVIFYGSANRANYLLLSPVFTFLALLSKEIAILTIVILPLYDFLIARRTGKWRLLAKPIPQLAAYIMYFILRYSALKSFAYDDRLPSGFAKYLASLPGFLAQFIAMEILPIPMTYRNATVGNISAEWIAAGIVFALAAIFCAVWLFKTKRMAALFGSIWAVIFVVPVVVAANKLPTVLADRYTFLSSVGMAIVVGYIAKEWLAKSKSKLVYVFFGACFALFWCLSFAQSFAWKNDATFYRKMIADAPDYPAGYTGLAAQMLKDGETDSAGYYCKIAYSQSAYYLPTMNILTAIYTKKERYDSLKIILESIMSTHPQYPYGFMNYGLYLIRTGDTTGAEPYLKKAFSLAPRDHLINQNLGSLELVLGNTNLGVKLLERSMAYNPEVPAAAICLFNHYLECGDSANANKIAERFPIVRKYRAKNALP